MEPVEFSVAQIEPHLQTGKLSRLLEGLTRKYEKDGFPEPGQRAKVDIARLLSAAFTKVGEHWEGVKAASLERLGKLQVKALAFYKDAMAGKDLNAEVLRDLLREMDKEFRTIAKDTQKLAEDHPPVTKEVTFDPATNTTTTKYDGGAEAGGATYEKTPTSKRGTVRVQGPHPNRPKGALDDPEGLRPGEHRGHGAPEGAVDNPELTNVPENVESETEASNLGPKKRLDNLVSKTAAAFAGHLTLLRFERILNPGDPRPVATAYELVVDGMTLYKVTIPNE